MAKIKDRTGETHIMSNNLKATIIEYRGVHDIDVQFENGEIVRNVGHNNYKRGQVACPAVIKSAGDGAVTATNVNCNPPITFMADIDDLPLIHAYNWSIDRKVYIKNSTSGIRFHRAVIGAKQGDVVDHIDGNTLNNRKRNLRICTQFDNQKNRGANKNNTSGYKGVCWNKDKKKWTAQLFSDGRRVLNKHFDTKEAAAHAYNEAAIKYHGEFAKLNNMAERRCENGQS